MASQATKAIGKNVALRVAKGPVAVEKKYTVQSTGIWERIRRTFAVDPSRSNGVPLNPQFRHPAPGSIPPESYSDPVTIPAGDIAENPYWKRDMRRNYPRLSVTTQSDVVGLLTFGSKANPKADVPLIGDAGAKQLVQVKQEGEENGLAALFEKDTGSLKLVLGPDGLPPRPSGLYRQSDTGAKAYVMEALDDQSYEGKYPCRTFT